MLEFDILVSVSKSTVSFFAPKMQRDGDNFSVIFLTFYCIAMLAVFYKSSFSYVKYTVPWLK